MTLSKVTRQQNAGRHPVTLDDATMQEIIANSFLDFHAKGVSYLCLRRTPERTSKIYFFEGDVSKLPEVAAPHDHRYRFRTHCLTGAVENRLYMPRALDSNCGRIYQKFEWRTPLNGGDGFSWVGEECLEVTDAQVSRCGQSYLMSHDAIHTIQLREPGTVLALEQFADIVPLHSPTTTWMIDREPPSLSGLYRKPTADDVLRLMGILDGLGSIADMSRKVLLKHSPSVARH